MKARDDNYAFTLCNVTNYYANGILSVILYKCHLSQSSSSRLATLKNTIEVRLFNRHLEAFPPGYWRWLKYIILCGLKSITRDCSKKNETGFL